MKTHLNTIEEIRSTLTKLRKDPNTKRRFPKFLWDSIIRLTKVYPLEDICCQTNIHPAYLKHKIRQFKKEPLEFREVTFSSLPSPKEITIELSSPDGLKAVIRGPISCLDCLYPLFGG